VGGGLPRGVPRPLTPLLPPADKLFGKRLLQAGRYIMSHKAWMKTVPTENCDVLMTFPGREMSGVPGTGAAGAGVERWDGGTELRRGWGTWGGMGSSGVGWAGRCGTPVPAAALTGAVQTPPTTTRCSGS